MPAESASVFPDVKRLHDGEADIDFARIWSAAGRGDDDMLAELIEADGRLRIARGRMVALERYLHAVPNLLERSDPLDAAIDVTLRSISGSSRITAEAVEGLIQRHPELADAIREAAALNAAVWSTTGLRARLEQPPSKSLPSDFGPRMPGGQPRYQLQELRGQGAFGQVYLARDRQLSEEGHSALVAIKILFAGERLPIGRERLLEEATKVRRINHPNVVQVLDRGVTDHDEDFIVYEFVDGGDLAQRIAQKKPCTVRDAVQLVARIARGLHAAHSAGVIHCDLKPSNIMLTAAGDPKVADFGIAVRTGEVHSIVRSSDGPHGPAGNRAFISPEQFRNEPGALAVPSDIYALGGMLFLLLTGSLPNGSTMGQIAATHDAQKGRREPPRLRHLRAGIDADLEAICRRALALKPQERHESAAALADDLERWMRQEPIGWTKPGTFKVLRLWARRKPALAAVLAALALLVISAAVVGQRLLIAQVKLDQEKQWRLEGNKAAVAGAAALSRLKNDYRINTDVLAQIWTLEYVFGPTVLDLGDAQAELWKSRIIVIRNLVTLAKQQGRENHFETLMWESALAFWLVSDKDWKEAEPLLAENQRKWSALLAPTDEWLSDLSALRACAAINRLADESRAGTADLEPGGELHRVEASLRGAEARIAQHHAGTPMHYLVLDKLIEANGPALLNQPEQVNELQQRKEALLAKKPDSK